jgi:cytochrome c oxidase assembly protein Cox11
MQRGKPIHVRFHSLLRHKFKTNYRPKKIQIYIKACKTNQITYNQFKFNFV